MSRASPTSAALASARELVRRGRHAEATPRLHELLSRADARADAAAMLGAIARHAGDLAAALRWFDVAVDASGGHPAALANRAAVRLERGESRQALADARAAAERDPASFGAWYNVGQAALVLERPAEAEAAFARALALRPDHPGALSGLAESLQRLGADALAVPQLERLVQGAAPDRMHRLRLAHALANSLRGERAQAIYRELARDPDASGQVASAGIIAMHGDPSTRPEAVLGAAKAWARRFAPAPAEDAPRARGPCPRRLRIGWLSPRFNAGPVATFLTPLLSALDRGRTEHLLYATHDWDDAAGHRLRQHADGWRPVASLDDGALYQRLREDRLDVLVELSGHGPMHRLAVLARRAAPVQLAWLDAFCTTGVPAVDGFVSDPALSPPGSEVAFSERLWRLPRMRLCYGPPPDAPEPEPFAPAQGLRFASFNRPNKLDPDQLAAWGRILRARPDASLLLKAHGFERSDVADYWRRELSALGLPPAQLRFAGFGTHRDALLAWREVDIALDSHPFSGCATTADALWMGVPVVTRVGDTLVSRQSAALLAGVGLGDLVADDAAGFEAAALALADDPARRTALRRELRGRMRREHDPARFAGEFEAMLRSAWAELASGS